jgi:hypothetical protein
MSYGTYCRLNVHVRATPREVIKAARRKIRKDLRSNPEFRAARKHFYRDMLGYHERAAKLADEWRLV